jgi:hypothetical protein
MQRRIGKTGKFALHAVESSLSLLLRSRGDRNGSIFEAGPPLWSF